MFNNNFSGQAIFFFQQELHEILPEYKNIFKGRKECSKKLIQFASIFPTEI